MFAKTISKEEITELPLTSFEGKVIVIDKPGQVKDAVAYLSKQKVLGFDTETKPSFKKGVKNKVALLQLSDDKMAFLFRLNRIGLPTSVASILADKRILKTGVAIHDDIKCLQEICRFQSANFLELQQFVKKFNIENFGLKKLAAIVLNIRISKSQQLTNWDSPSLTPAQIRYAATDAWVPFKVFKKLKSIGQQTEI